MGESDVRLTGARKGLSVSKRIYRTSLAALENIINVQDTVQSHLELLEEQEKELSEERKKLELVSKDLQGMFPSGRNLDRTSRVFFKRLKSLDRDQSRKNLQEAYDQQVVRAKKSSTSKGIVIGVLAGIVVAALGVLVWKGLGKSKKREMSFDEAVEIARWKGVSSYLQSELE